MNEIILLILSSLYFFLPAYFGNMAPVLTKDMLKFFAIPIDRGIKFRKKPLLGKNKTLRGVIMAVLFGIVIILFLYFGFLHPLWGLFFNARQPESVCVGQ